MLQRLSEPFTALLALQRALESRRGSDWLAGSTAGMGSYPPINVFQQGADFVAVIELPGIDKSELKIEALDKTIKISGKKAVETGSPASVHRRERISGTFNRTISLPIQIDPDSIRAEYRDGLLALFIPRAPSEKPRSIQIN
jgi:HSP20 family protein